MDNITMFYTLITVTTLFIGLSYASSSPYAYEFDSPEYGYGPYDSPHMDGYMSDWAPGREWGAGGRADNSRCFDIPRNMSLCKDIGYPSMRLPNLLGHETMREALQQAGQWVPLLRRKCHPDTMVFLCSLFSPVCLDRPIYPCRSLCEGVQAGCEENMMRYGYPWPEMLSCDKFPLDNSLCIGLVSAQEEGEVTCPACNQPNTFEAIVDNYCSSTAVYRSKLRTESEEDGEKVVTSGKKIRKMRGAKPTAEQKRTGLHMYIPNSDKCECGLAHSKSPDYIAMGNYEQGRFVVTAFHLYEKKDADLKRALRLIRRDESVCGVGGIHQLYTRDSDNDNNSKQGRDKPSRRKNERESGEQSPRRKPRPDAEEIARRKAERAERRRQEREKQNGRRSEEQGGAQGGEEVEGGDAASRSNERRRERPSNDKQVRADRRRVKDRSRGSRDRTQDDDQP